MKLIYSIYIFLYHLKMSVFTNLTDYLNDPIVQTILKRNNVPIQQNQKKTNSEVPVFNAGLKSKDRQDKCVKTTLEQELETINKEIQSLTNSNNKLFNTINNNNETIKLNEIENVKLQSKIDSNIKNNETLKKANSEFFEKVAVNNGTIEKLESHKIEVLEKIEIQKKIAQDPLFNFRNDINEVSRLKDFDVSSILNQFEQLYKSINDLSVRVSLDKLPIGKYDLMIESTSQNIDVKNKISSFRALFMMLNSLL